jgi:hypothetical protein
LPGFANDFTHRNIPSGQGAPLAPAQPAEPAPHSGDSGVEIMYWMSIAAMVCRQDLHS